MICGVNRTTMSEVKSVTYIALEHIGWRSKNWIGNLDQRKQAMLALQINHKPNSPCIIVMHVMDL